MEIIDFKDLLNKCRCCFQYLEKKCDKIEINLNHKRNFLELTKIELRDNEEYSTFFCLSCDENLKKSLSFMKQAKERQTKLYEELKESLNKPTDQMEEYEELEIIHEEHQNFEEISENIPTPKVINIKRNIVLPSRYRTNAQEIPSEQQIEISKRSKREGSFTCDACQMKFYQRKNLLIHKRSCHMKNVKCKFANCDLMFRFNSSMEVHMNRVHLNLKVCDSTFYCDNCDYSTSLKASMKRHVLSHIEKTLECDQCRYKTNRLDCLQTHKLSHGKRPNHPCKICEKRYFTISALKAHIRYAHSKIRTCYPCKFCGLTLKSILTLENHLKKSHPDVEASIPCEVDECDVKFFSKQGRKKHMRDKHLASVKCLNENCTRMFYYENLMLNHFAMVHEKEKYAGEHLCNICGKTFTFLNYLLEHMKIHSENRKTFKCEFCEKEFKTNESLVAHRFQHTKSHPDIECEQCDKKFYDKRSLKTHIHFSHKIYEPVCEVCGKSFSSITGLKEHWAKFHDDKEPDILCEHCSEKFKTRKLLNKHVNMKHREMKSCEYCEKKFSETFLLNRHVKSSHLNMKFHCVYPGCFKSYAFKMKLKQHLSKHTANLSELNEYYSLIKDLKATESLE